ncbi:hypothetical protein STEG23_024378 [Scotinomys teguina]
MSPNHSLQHLKKENPMEDGGTLVNTRVELSVHTIHMAQTDNDLFLGVERIPPYTSQDELRRQIVRSPHCFHSSDLSNGFGTSHSSGTEDSIVETFFLDRIDLLPFKISLSRF